MVVHARRWKGAVPLAAVAVAAVAAGAGAVGATTAPEPVPVATALTNPRGFTWGDDGVLVVAMAGSGGDAPATEDTPSNAILGPMGGGTTGAVVTIDESGCPAPLVTGLASTLTGTGEVLGAEDVAYLDGDLYIGVDGGGPSHGNADLPSGIYRLNDEGAAELVADLSAWVRENPVAAVPGDFDPDAAGYSLVVDPESNTLWVDDPNSGQILSVAADGTVTRVADLSDPHVVPTRLALDPDGGVYVGTLTPVPFPDGAAKVMHVGTDGTVEDVWTGLTTVVDVAVGPDGTLYALEMSTGNLVEPPFLTPGSGRIVRQTGPDTAEPVAEGLMFPIAMEIGPDGAFYVATPAIGANDGSGSIVRIAMDGDVVDDTVVAPAGECAPIEETTGTMPAGPEANTSATAPAAEESSPAAEATVTIAGFAFGPAELTVVAGTTVTFVNSDTAPHTVTADDGSFDTGSIAPGESATVTIDTAGTFAYHCNFHPTMTATLVVT